MHRCIIYGHCTAFCTKTCQGILKHSKHCYILLFVRFRRRNDNGCARRRNANLAILLNLLGTIEDLTPYMNRAFGIVFYVPHFHRDCCNFLHKHLNYCIIICCDPHGKDLYPMRLFK